ncbi:unnamed protein product [Prunus brigantina]
MLYKIDLCKSSKYTKAKQPLPQTPNDLLDLGASIGISEVEAFLKGSTTSIFSRSRSLRHSVEHLECTTTSLSKGAI